MLLDKNGMISIEYIYSDKTKTKGDFSFIPKSAVVATIKEYYHYIDEFDNYKSITKCYRIILGNPVYKHETIITSNDCSNYIENGKKTILVIGQTNGTNYYVIPKKDDIIVPTREEFINLINHTGIEFLEALDNIDSNKSKLTLH